MSYIVLSPEEAQKIGSTVIENILKFRQRLKFEHIEEYRKEWSKPNWSEKLFRMKVKQLTSEETEEIIKSECEFSGLEVIDYQIIHADYIWNDRISLKYEKIAKGLVLASKLNKEVHLSLDDLNELENWIDLDKE